MESTFVRTHLCVLVTFRSANVSLSNGSLRNLKYSWGDKNVLWGQPAGFFHGLKCVSCCKWVGLQGRRFIRIWTPIASYSSKGKLNRVSCIARGCGCWNPLYSAFLIAFSGHVWRVCGPGDPQTATWLLSRQRFLGPRTLWKDKEKHFVFS